eukprot:358198-Chlamydomonas_euryale.AAC.8
MNKTDAFCCDGACALVMHQHLQCRRQPVDCHLGLSRPTFQSWTCTWVALDGIKHRHVLCSIQVVLACESQPSIQKRSMDRINAVSTASPPPASPSLQVNRTKPTTSKMRRQQDAQ